MSDLVPPRPSRLAEIWHSDFVHALRHAPVALVSLAVVLLLVLSALFAPLIAPHNPLTRRR